jgi:hypothetical protein
MGKLYKIQQQKRGDIFAKGERERERDFFSLFEQN